MNFLVELVIWACFVASVFCFAFAGVMLVMLTLHKDDSPYGKVLLRYDRTKAAFRALFGALLLLMGLTLSGCNTSEVGAAYKVSVGTDATVRGAMTGWGIYVSLKHPSTNDEETVRRAWLVTKNAELGVIDAEAVLLNDPTNTAPLLQAEQVWGVAQTNLINIITVITNRN